MGLAKPALHFLIREHAANAFAGPVLTLGRQTLVATRADVAELLEREGLAIPSPLTTPKQNATRITDAEFFAWLGLGEVVALDYSTYEHAEILHDLNLPLPDHLRGRFGLVVDGGTLEHVFDVRAGLRNVCALLRPGGRVLHISPANNWTNHGFYQFSPTLYFDFYSANHFTNLRGYVVAQPLLGFEFSRWEFFPFAPGIARLTSTQGLMNFFVAEKTDASSGDEIPIQSFYQQLYTFTPPARATRLQKLRAHIPYRLQALLAQHVVWLNPYRKPWGLTHKRKLG